MEETRPLTCSREPLHQLPLHGAPGHLAGLPGVVGAVGVEGGGAPVGGVLALPAPTVPLRTWAEGYYLEASIGLGAAHLGLYIYRNSEQSI